MSVFNVNSYVLIFYHVLGTNVGSVGRRCQPGDGAHAQRLSLQRCSTGLVSCWLMGQGPHGGGGTTGSSSILASCLWCDLGVFTSISLGVLIC